MMPFRDFEERFNPMLPPPPPFDFGFEEEFPMMRGSDGKPRKQGHGPMKGPHRNLKKKNCKKNKKSDNKGKGKGKGDEHHKGKKHHGPPRHCMFKACFGFIFSIWGLFNLIGYYYHFGAIKCINN